MTVENRWQKILASLLDGAAVEPARNTARPDLVIRTRDGQSIMLEVKWAGEGWPQDVRRAVEDVPDPWPANVVVLARQMSPGAMEWLRDRDANWADEAGQARILGPGGLIVIREPRLPRVERGARRFNWSASAITVGEAILASEDRPLRVADLAARSGWSAPQVAKVLKAFDDQGWTVKRGAARGPAAHREFVDADSMLAAWSGGVAEAPRATRIAHRATRDVFSLLRDDLAPALSSVTWAVTGWAGLELAAPFATTTPSLHIYVSDVDFTAALTDALDTAGLHEVEEGGRVTFWEADPRILALAATRDGIPVVTPPRLYADLSAFGARGQDAADHVKSELIDPLHNRAAIEEDSQHG